MNELFSDIGELQLRFILLAGDDATSRELSRAEIIDAVRGRKPGAEVDRYNSDESGFGDFCERIITPSLFAPARVFLIPDVHILDEKEFDALSGIFAFDLPDVCVIMETEKLRGGRKTGDKALSKKYSAWLDSFESLAQKSPERFLVREFAQPPDYRMAEWVEARAPHLFGRRISKSDAEYLVDLVGADTALLYPELQKIDLYLAPEAAISREVIDTVAGATRLMTQFELAQAMGEKKFSRVLEIIESIYTGTPYLPLYVGAIFRHFWTLFKIYQFTKANPGTLGKYRSSARQSQNEAALEIAVAAGILSEKQANRLFPAMIKPRMVEQALTFTHLQYKKIFSLLKEFDIGLKTGTHDDSKAGFQVFCYRIVKGNE